MSLRNVRHPAHVDIEGLDPSESDFSARFGAETSPRSRLAMNNGRLAPPSVGSRLLRFAAGLLFAVVFFVWVGGPNWRGSGAAERPSSRRVNVEKDSVLLKPNEIEVTQSVSNSHGKFPLLKHPLESAAGHYSPSSLDHLVMVACHAALLQFDTSHHISPEHIQDRSLWAVKSYQNADDVHLYLKHIEHGMALAEKDPKALVIFSGGFTNNETKWSEGYSYWIAADVLRGDKPPPDSGPKGVPVSYRMIVDDTARDSYENLLFSLCRFRAFTGELRHFEIEGVGLAHTTTFQDDTREKSPSSPTTTSTFDSSTSTALPSDTPSPLSTFSRPNSLLPANNTAPPTISTTTTKARAIFPRNYTALNWLLSKPSTIPNLPPTPTPTKTWPRSRSTN